MWGLTLLFVGRKRHIWVLEGTPMLEPVKNDTISADVSRSQREWETSRWRRRGKYSKSASTVFACKRTESWAQSVKRQLLMFTWMNYSQTAQANRVDPGTAHFCAPDAFMRDLPLSGSPSLQLNCGSLLVLLVDGVGGYHVVAQLRP